ncbi:MAG: sulfatase, partial [Pirellulales bacterium]
MMCNIAVRTCIAALVSHAFFYSSTRADEPVKPNIVVIVGDDMGYADIGVHGCKDIPTPHIDELAASGVRCTNGYVSGPYCSPTRAGLLTGRYQTRFGHEFNPGGGQKRQRQRQGQQAQREERQRGGAIIGLPVSEITMANRLKEAGYITGLIGKWHLGSADRFHPQRRGFDEFFGFLGGAHAYFPGEGAPILRGTEAVDEQEYLTDAIGREAESFIDRHADRPFFLYLCFNAVHTPMHADDARLAKFENIADEKRRTYAAMMSAMDDAIGAVLAKLRDAQLEEKTLVFFISDNGGPMLRGTTINGSSNAPLRGSKRTTLEGGVRVPFFVKWPGRLPAGRLYDEPVIQLDILPTALAAANIEIPSDTMIDGVNLLPYLRGDNSGKPHDQLYWRFGQQMAIRQGDWKLVRYDPVIDGLEGAATEPKLYNLADDIGERNNVIEKEPERAKSLQAAWDKWNASNVPPLWGGGDG